MMIDTIKIRHQISHFENQDFKQTWEYRSKLNYEVWFLNPKKSKILPRLTIVHTLKGEYYLSAEVSLPKMIFGNNVYLPNQIEIEKGLNLINEYIESLTGLKFDVSSAIVTRIDFVKDFTFEEAKVGRLIFELSKMFLPNKRFLYDSTLYYGTKSGSKEVCIYSKYREVQSENEVNPDIKKMANGILRLEVRYKKLYVIKTLVKKLRLKDCTIKSFLNENVLKQIVSEVTKSLNFNELLISKETNLEILMKRYSFLTAIRLSGFIDVVSLLGENFYHDESQNIGRSSYFNNKRLCVKANVWKRSEFLE